MSIYHPLSEALGIPYEPTDNLQYEDDWCGLPNGVGPLNSFYGKHHTEEYKRERSEAYKGRGNHFYGKQHTEETKRMISERTKEGMKNAPPRTQEHNEKIRKSLLGKPLSDERRKKIGAANKGKIPWNKGMKTKCE